MKLTPDRRNSRDRESGFQTRKLTNFYYYVALIRGVTFSGGLVISSTGNGGHNYYNGNGSLPRHTLQQSYVYKPNPEQGGPMTSGLATRVWRQQSNVPYWVSFICCMFFCPNLPKCAWWKCEVMKVSGTKMKNVKQFFYKRLWCKKILRREKNS